MKKYITTTLAILLLGAFLNTTTQAQVNPTQNGLIPQTFGNLQIELPLTLEPQPEDAAKIFQKNGHNLSACRAYHKISNEFLIKVIESVYKQGKSYNPEIGIKSEMKIITGVLKNTEIPSFENTEINGFPAQIAVTSGFLEETPVTVKALSIQEGQTVWFIYVFVLNDNNQGLATANTILNTATIASSTDTEPQTPAFVPETTRVSNSSVPNTKTNSGHHSINKIPAAGITIGMPVEDVLRTKAFANAERFQYPTNYDGESAAHILKSIQAQGKPKLPKDVINGFITAYNPGDTLYGLPISEIIIRVTWNNTTQQYVVTQIDTQLEKSIDRNIAEPKMIEMLTTELGPSKHKGHWEDNTGTLTISQGVRIWATNFREQLEKEFQAATSNYNEATSSPTKGIFDN